MCQTPIDVQVEEITGNVLQNESASSREIAVALEANQLYIEYLDWLKDNLFFADDVTIEFEGTRINFQNMDDFANWLSEHIE